LQKGKQRQLGKQQKKEGTLIQGCLVHRPRVLQFENGRGLSDCRLYYGQFGIYKIIQPDESYKVIANRILITDSDTEATMQLRELQGIHDQDAARVGKELTIHKEKRVLFYSPFPKIC
jgi:hypothetical protein